MRVVGCILYQFVHLLLHDHLFSRFESATCQQSSGFESVFSEGRERLSLSVMSSQPPVRCSSRSLSLYLACSLNNEHHFECIDCDYCHYLGPHHNNKFLHSVTQQRSRYAVELLVLDDDGLGVVESIKTHGRALEDKLIGFQGVCGEIVPGPL
jgi:hypothetical protein